MNRILKFALGLLLVGVLPIHSQEEVKTTSEVTGQDVMGKIKTLINATFECSVYEGKDSLDSITEDGKLESKKKGKLNEISFKLKSGKKFLIELSDAEISGKGLLKIRDYKDLPEYTAITKSKDGSTTAFIFSPNNDQTRILKVAGQFSGKHYELQCDPKKP